MTEHADAPDDAPDAVPEGEYWKVEDAPEAPTLEALIEVLREGDPIACEKAVEQLGEMGEAALPTLQALLEDDNPDVRVDAAKAIARIADA